MPFPLVTCLLVLACVVSTADTLSGAIIAAVATVIQFFLTPVTSDGGIPPGTPDPDTYSL